MWSMHHPSLLLSRDSIGAGRLFSVWNSWHLAYNCCNSCHMAYKCCISAYCAFVFLVYQCLVYALPLNYSHYDLLHFSSRWNRSISANHLIPNDGVRIFEQRSIHRTWAIEHDNHSSEAWKIAHGRLQRQDQRCSICTVLLCNIIWLTWIIVYNTSYSNKVL